MGRPRHGKALKRTITVSLSEETIAVLDALGSNRSAIIEGLAAGVPFTVAAPMPDGRVAEARIHPVSQQETPTFRDREPLPDRKQVTPIFKK